MRHDDLDDALSDVLRLIRLQGCLYFLADFCSPWGMHIGGGAVAQFHVVLEGQCWLTMAAEQRRLGEGDCVVFPWGDGHALSDPADGPRRPGLEVLQAVQRQAPPFQHGDRAIRLLCGHFEFDRGVRHPLLAELPRLIHTKGRQAWQPGWLELVSPVLVAETTAGKPGAATIVDRLAEVLFIQVLRAFFVEQAPASGFLAAVMDRRINRALKLIHQEWQQDLSLDGLAQAIGMSRSNLAIRFKELLGVTPIAYLTSWRMQQARELLEQSDAALVEIAEQVGYGSEAAFSRAFRREFAQSPGWFRRSHLDRAADSVETS